MLAYPGGEVHGTCHMHNHYFRIHHCHRCAYEPAQAYTYVERLYNSSGVKGTAEPANLPADVYSV
jgi:hypothetical protein